MILAAHATDADGVPDTTPAHQWVKTPTVRANEPHVALSVNADAACATYRLTQRAALALAEQLQDAVAACYGEVRGPHDR